MKDLRNLRRQLRKRNVIAASDGSVVNKKSAHSWALLRRDTGESIIGGRAPVDGNIADITSTRTEIMGVLACATFIKWIHNHFFKIRRRITLYTDSLSTIHLSKKYDITSTKSVLQNDIDATIELQHYLKKHDLIRLEHVFGHQDKDTPFEDLDILAQANVRMDRSVGEFTTNMPAHLKNTASPPLLPTQKLCLRQHNCAITSNIRENLIDSFNLPPRVQYLQKHLNIDLPNMKHIDWSAIKRFLRAQRLKKGKFVKCMNSQ